MSDAQVMLLMLGPPFWAMAMLLMAAAWTLIRR
jgi:hypothetical protein